MMRFRYIQSMLALENTDLDYIVGWVLLTPGHKWTVEIRGEREERPFILFDTEAQAMAYLREQCGGVK